MAHPEPHPANGLDLGTTWARLDVHGTMGVLALIVLVFALAVGAMVWTVHRGFASMAEARDAQTAYFVQQHAVRAQEATAVLRALEATGAKIDAMTAALNCNTWIRATVEERRVLRLNVGMPACMRGEGA